MNAATEHFHIDGPAGAIDCALDLPSNAASAGTGTAARGLAVICHPHPLFGGTLDNKVVQTLARALVQLGYRSLRFNFRGIGASAGSWDEGRGEVDDALAVVAACRGAAEPLVLAGFSFGGYVAATAAQRLVDLHMAADVASASPVERLVLVAPAVVNFTTPPVPTGTLLIHGESDDVVPLAAAFDWARPQSMPITVVPGAGHFFHGRLPLLKQIVVDAWAARPALPAAI